MTKRTQRTEDISTVIGQLNSTDTPSDDDNQDSTGAYTGVFPPQGRK